MLWSKHPILPHRHHKKSAEDNATELHKENLYSLTSCTNLIPPLSVTNIYSHPGRVFGFSTKWIQTVSTGRISNLYKQKTTPKYVLVYSGQTTYRQHKKVLLIFGWESVYKIHQFRYVKIEAQTIDLRTRLWGINPTNSVFIPQSLVLRSIVWCWILIYRKWSIASVVSWPSLLCNKVNRSFRLPGC